MENSFNGKIYEGTYESSTYYSRAVFPYKVFVPDAEAEEYALVVGHDFLNEGEVRAMQELAEAGEAPYCIFAAIIPAKLPATTESGIDRDLRMNTYDVFSDKYPNFIVDEMIPYLTEKYGLRISASPDMHMTSGGSSGGMSAWNLAWHRTDYFRRVYMSSPSFLSMCRGDEMINLVRKFETKPIRVFVDYSENEPDDYFGSSFCVADASVRALRFAGYDMMWDYHPGEGHCSRHTNYENALERMRFLWKDWKTESVVVKKLSERCGRVISIGEGWKKCDPSLIPKYPEIRLPYGNILHDIATVVDSLGNAARMALSSDKWRLYFADKHRGCVYAASVNSDGTLGDLYTQGALHHKTDFRYPGAFDIAVDNEDRIYAATEIGIQCIRSYGLIDVILDNPDGRIAQRIAVGNDGYLYALCGDDCYRRKLNGKTAPDPVNPNPPKQTSYYD